MKLFEDFSDITLNIARQSDEKFIKVTMRPFADDLISKQLFENPNPSPLPVGGVGISGYSA